MGISHAVNSLPTFQGVAVATPFPLFRFGVAAVVTSRLLIRQQAFKSGGTGVRSLLLHVESFTPSLVSEGVVLAALASLRWRVSVLPHGASLPALPLGLSLSVVHPH